MQEFWKQARLPVIIVVGTVAAIAVTIGMGYAVYGIAKNSETIGKYAGNALVSILAAVVTALMYFLPFVCAIAGKHRNAASVFVLNLGAGPIGVAFLSPGIAALLWVLTLAYAVAKPAPRLVAVLQPVGEQRQVTSARRQPA